MLVAEHQVAGRGRLDRIWTSPPRAGLTVSFLLRPDVPAAPPRLAAAADRRRAGRVGRRGHRRPALAQVAQRPARPRRPQAGRDPRREHAAAAVVVGVGLNVSTTAEELPETATSLRRVTGATVDRAPVLLAFLRAVERRYRRWTEHLGDPVSSGLAQDYLAWSSTVGATVAVDPARRLDPRGGRRGGRLGRPARRRHRRGHGGARHRRRAARATRVTTGTGGFDLARAEGMTRGASRASSWSHALSGQAAGRRRGDRPAPASALADGLLARRPVPADRRRGLLRGRADPGRPAAGGAPAARRRASPCSCCWPLVRRAAAALADDALRDHHAPAAVPRGDPGPARSRHRARRGSPTSPTPRRCGSGSSTPAR